MTVRLVCIVSSQSKVSTRNGPAARPGCRPAFVFSNSQQESMRRCTTQTYVTSLVDVSLFGHFFTPLSGLLHSVRRSSYTVHSFGSDASLSPQFFSRLSSVEALQPATSTQSSCILHKRQALYYYGGCESRQMWWPEWSTARKTPALYRMHQLWDKARHKDAQFTQKDAVPQWNPECGLYRFTLQTLGIK